MMKTFFCLLQLLIFGGLTKSPQKELHDWDQSHHSLVHAPSQCIYLNKSKCSYYQINWNQSNIQAQFHAPQPCSVGTSQVLYTGETNHHSPLTFSLPALANDMVLVWQEMNHHNHTLQTKLIFLVFPEEQINHNRRNLLNHNNTPLVQPQSLFTKTFIPPLQLYEEQSFSWLIIASQYFGSKQNQAIHLVLMNSKHDNHLPSWLSCNSINETALRFSGIPPIGSANQVYKIGIAAFDLLGNDITQAFEIKIHKKESSTTDSEPIEEDSDIIVIVLDIVSGGVMMFFAAGFACCAANICYCLQEPIKPKHIKLAIDMGHMPHP